METTEEERWRRAAEEVRANPALRANMIESALSSMRLSGFIIDRETAERVFDDAIDGPPLVFRADHP